MSDRNSPRILLDRIFPFHFSVERSGHIRDLGPRLGEIAGENLAGADFFELEALDAPMAVRNFEGLRQMEGEIQVVILPMLGGLKLRGEFAHDDNEGWETKATDREVIRFLGHPWITALDQLAEHGLSLKDFPPNAGLADLLILLQAQNNSMEDMRRLTDQLQTTSATLEERNATLEKELAHRERLEAQLQQAQKMEAIGRLAGGVAHDFNNVLLAISGHAALGGMATEIDESKRHLEQIVAATQRATDITGRLLAFARRSRVKIEAISLSDALEEAASMLAPLLGERHELFVEIQPDASAVRSDPAALQQAIVNLVMNARDASPDGGPIWLRARRDSSDTPVAMHGGERPAGEWGVVEVEDRGHGMDDGTIERIFEPFFTTKGRTQGTGLGLATVWWVMERSQGAIGVWSQPGEGTRFSLHLPHAENCTVSPKPSKNGHSQGHGERVLFVEDDDLARPAMLELLRSNGWEVTAASSAEAALEVVEASDEPFDILISDVVMPGRSGRELAARVRERHPTTKIVLISGYDSDRAGHADPDGGEVLLAKPFTLAELNEAVGSAH